MKIDVIIEDELKSQLTNGWISKLVRKVLRLEKVAYNTQLSVLVTNQTKVRELNKTYRHKNKPTDVLSFSMNSQQQKEPNDIFITPPDNICHLGELIISYPQALLQAKEKKHAVKMEMTILLIHGVLHLLGYDHEEPGKAEEKMREREALLLNQVRSKIKTIKNKAVITAI